MVKIFGIKNLSTVDRILRAKVHMYKQKSPFFAYILLNMKVKEFDKKTEEIMKQMEMPLTMAVDPDGNLWYHDKWVSKLTDDEMMGVLAHEVLHIALFHLERGSGKERRIFNVANDIVVNDMLQEQQFVLPKEGIIPKDHKVTLPVKGGVNIKIEKCNEKSSEEIYDEIMAQIPPSKSKMVIQGMPNTMDGHIYKDKEDAQSSAKNRRQQKWKKVISEAATMAKQQGDLPAGLERMIEEILDSKMSWKERLYKYMVDQIISDYSWGRPSKRSWAVGMYLPTTVRENIKIVASVDTSGSIGQEELRDFLSELVSIGMSFENIEIEIIVCDAEVHETYTVTKDNMDDVVNMKFSGGGGTSHMPVMKHIKEYIPDCKVAVHFTDGYSDINDLAKDDEIFFDNLWVLSKHGVSVKDITFGDAISLNESDVD